MNMISFCLSAMLISDGDGLREVGYAFKGSFIKMCVVLITRADIKIEDQCASNKVVRVSTCRKIDFLKTIISSTHIAHQAYASLMFPSYESRS